MPRGIPVRHFVYIHKFCKKSNFWTGLRRPIFARTLNIRKENGRKSFDFCKKSNFWTRQRRPIFEKETVYGEEKYP